MSEILKDAARRLANAAINQGYKPQALHEYTDGDGGPLYWRIRLKNPLTGEKWIRPTRWASRNTQTANRCTACTIWQPGLMMW